MFVPPINLIPYIYIKDFLSFAYLLIFFFHNKLKKERKFQITSSSLQGKSTKKMIWEIPLANEWMCTTHLSMFMWGLVVITLKMLEFLASVGCKCNSKYNTKQDYKKICVQFIICLRAEIKLLTHLWTNNNNNAYTP